MSFQDFGPGIGVLSSKYVIVYIQDFKSLPRPKWIWLRNYYLTKFFIPTLIILNCKYEHPSLSIGKKSYRNMSIMYEIRVADSPEKTCSSPARNQAGTGSRPLFEFSSPYLQYFSEYFVWAEPERHCNSAGLTLTKLRNRSTPDNFELTVLCCQYLKNLYK